MYCTIHWFFSALVRTSTYLPETFSPSSHTMISSSRHFSHS